MAYRVDTIPLIVRPLYLGLSWLTAFLMRLLLNTILFTCKLEFEGEEKLKGHKGLIYTFWHDQLVYYFMVFRKVKEKQVWLNHPLWYMKPIHYSLYMMGVEKLALGSSGNSGKEALEIVINDLKKGYSTVVNPDGPRGPVKVLKPGVLIMAERSGLPIIPVTFSSTREYRLNTWEKKRCPYPFSKITVKYGRPIFVKDADDEAIKWEVAEALGK